MNLLETGSKLMNSIENEHAFWLFTDTRRVYAQAKYLQYLWRWPYIRLVLSLFAGRLEGYVTSMLHCSICFKECVLNNFN